MPLALLAPALVTLIGLVLIGLSARRAAEEATALRRSVARFGELRPAVVSVRDDVVALRARAATSRQR